LKPLTVLKYKEIYKTSIALVNCDIRDVHLHAYAAVMCFGLTVVESDYFSYFTEYLYFLRSLETLYVVWYCL